MLAGLLVSASLALANSMPKHQHQHHERDVDYVFQTATDVVFVTEVKTVTAGDSSAESAPTPVVVNHIASNPNGGDDHHDDHQDPAPEAPAAPTTSVTVEPTSESPPPPPPSPSPTPAESPAANSPAVAVASDAQLNDYQKAVIDAHNSVRRLHGAPDLVWDNGLESAAQTLAGQCDYHHDTDIGGLGVVYGQNIAIGAKPEDIGSIITKSFYGNEVGAFDSHYGDPYPQDGFEDWGHFTQVVWKSTTKVACATVYCPGGVKNNPGPNIPPYSTVCDYLVAGNAKDQYATNVSPKS